MRPVCCSRMKSRLASPGGAVTQTGRFSPDATCWRLSAGAFWPTTRNTAIIVKLTNGMIVQILLMKETSPAGTIVK